MSITAKMIAPCGMNCGGCLAYLREKNRCDGCRAPDRQCNKNCTIDKCERRRSKFCGHCDIFPCARLKQLDKRYRNKYGMSMIENLVAIADGGIRRFVADEKRRWTCPNCGETLCVHRPACLKCGAKRVVRQY